MSTIRTSSKVLFAAVLAVLLAGPAALATTRYVYPDGHGTYPTIQSAVTAAVAGDTVMLASGTYTGAGNRDVTFSGKAITVRSETLDPNDCIVDCQSLGRGFLFITDEGNGSVLRGVTITHGAAGTNKPGGAIRCGDPGFPPLVPAHHGSPTITDCRLINSGAANGGGMSCTNSSVPIVTNCLFSGNTASNLVYTPGGGLYCLQSNAVLSHCTFTNNTGNNGGGLYCESCLPDLDYCDFRGNQATLDGAGICANNAKPSLDYCTFYANTAASWGGGCYIYGNTMNSPFTNCTFYANSAGTSGFAAGAGVACDGYAHPTLTRCIIAMSPQGDAVNCGSTGAATITCCDIYGNAGGAGCVAGQIGSNNNFAANPGCCHPTYGDLTLRSESPCAPAHSPCGQLIGAWGVGCSGAMTFTVCPTGPADFTTIQAAINAALNGDIVELCDATFTGAGNRDLDYGGKAITVRSASGNPQACIIDCAWTGDPNQTRRGVSFHSGETSAAVLQGVKIINGHSSLDPNYEGGAGIKCVDAAPTITNCILANNVTEEFGGGMYCDQAAPTLTNCRFESNTSLGWGGGGFACLDSSATLNSCTFSENHAPYSHGGGAKLGGTANVTFTNCMFSSNNASDDGGGLANFAQATVTDCTFDHNTTNAHGGGMTCVAASATVLRCVFAYNSAFNPQWGAGGGLSLFGFAGPIQYCTFYGNSAAWEGGGVYSGFNANPMLDHCTFYGNSAPSGGGVVVGWLATLQNTIIAGSTQGEAVFCDPNSTATLACCDVIGNAGGDYVGCIAGQQGVSNNFSLPPIFCDPPNGNFTIRDDSPCAPAHSPPPCGLIGAWPVGCTAICRGDANCDHVISWRDIDYFVSAMNDSVSAWTAKFLPGTPSCSFWSNDVNNDGHVSWRDITPFVQKMNTTCP